MSLKIAAVAAAVAFASAGLITAGPLRCTEVDAGEPGIVFVIQDDAPVGDCPWTSPL
ncbi:hypothetical protein [Actinoplanes couchii]|uniref:Uncharacterized protein n=1 Tax=Actinoplanes couchii TaxID=403638 RepID=A0ABQ3XSR8_9ACTN|nr:hypothetical protein [Actinoplanes couchii]MDR6318519.1 hypothetical protein [Actinoplanes couchii]GID61551.1 hypothetical protein Aco03nite_099550 [Actinoplanes couchii]